MKRMTVLVLLILPVILFFTAMLLHQAHGPYWLSYNQDPEYQYLFNSLALAESKQTTFNPHPGATLQLLGAATLKISHALDFSVKDNLELAVLKDPEFYMTVLNTVLITFNVLLLFIIGLVTYILTKNVWLSLLLQFSPFFSNAMLTQGLPRISCEPLLLFASLLFLLILVKMVVSENLSKHAYWYMIALALVSGFGIATKLTFGPLLIIPLLVLPTLRNKISFLFLTGLSVILWTWPIISQYKPFYLWYKLFYIYICNIFAHTGYYGLGGQGIINSVFYAQNLWNLFGGNPLFFMILFFATGFIMRFSWSAATRKMAWQDISFRVLVAVTVAQLCAVLMVAKHSYDYYLLPVLSLSGFMLFLIFVYLRRLNYFNRFDTKKFALLIGVFFIFSSAWRIIDIRNVLIQNMQIKQESLAVYRKVESEYKNHLKISYFYSSSPITALFIGNFFLKGQYSEILQKIYGETCFFNNACGIFQTWTSVLSIEDVVKGYDHGIIFYGKPIFRETGDQVQCRNGSTLKLRNVLQGEYETIYVLQSITIPKEKPLTTTSNYVIDRWAKIWNISGNRWGIFGTDMD